MTTEANKGIVPRAPVVAVMGHIDHGKSTLIDYIRHTNLTEKEAGGITQHVSAYEITHTTEDKRQKPITFLDTPGHEAFGGIRKRGAGVADIAILVVSAEDGVKPQTLEARDRILESKVPYIIAITKIDKPSANIEHTKQTLAENNMYVEGYGGDIPFVPVSAKTGDGVNALLEMIVLVADMAELTREQDVAGEGIIVESKLDPKRGVTSIAIVTNGEVKRGMIAATEGAIAPLRLILDSAGNQVEEIEAGRPIQIIGWDNAPGVGNIFKTFLKKDDAQEYANTKNSKEGEAVGDHNKYGSDFKKLPFIIKSDVSGSLEAITAELNKLARERIVPKVIFSGIGAVNENDVHTAIAGPNATIIAFSSKIDSRAKALAERSGISILSFNIIYELIDEVKKILESSEPRIEVEETLGQIKVLKIFSVIKDKQVIGGRVETGEIRRGSYFKILRRNSDIGRGKVKELQQSKLDTDSVLEGNEFGTMLESKTEVTPGDILEVFTTVTK